MGKIESPRKPWVSSTKIAHLNWINKNLSWRFQTLKCVSVRQKPFEHIFQKHELDVGWRAEMLLSKTSYSKSIQLLILGSSYARNMRKREKNKHLNELFVVNCLVGLRNSFEVNDIPKICWFFQSIFSGETMGFAPPNFVDSTNLISPGVRRWLKAAGFKKDQEEPCWSWKKFFKLFEWDGLMIDIWIYYDLDKKHPDFWWSVIFQVCIWSANFPSF